MNKHTSKKFDESLSNLQDMIIEMGKLTENQLNYITNYLLGDNLKIPLETIENIDERIDNYLININEECMRLIATRAPVAIDLRFLNAADRIAIDMERIGDEICKIARHLQNDAVNSDSRLWRDIRSTLRLASDIHCRTLNILARIDVEEAYNILKDDTFLDDNYSSIMRQLITYMMEDAKNISTCIDILFAAKSLERIGDHCINISEAIIFYHDGKDVRNKR